MHHSSSTHLLLADSTLFFQHVFCHTLVTGLQACLVPLDLYHSLCIRLSHQLLHLPLASYIRWLTLVIGKLPQHVNSPR
jgi:hypothetical protein